VKITFCLYFRQKCIDLCETKTTNIIGAFYTYRRIHSTSRKCFIFVIFVYHYVKRCMLRWLSGIAPTDYHVCHVEKSVQSGGTYVHVKVGSGLD